MAYPDLSQALGIEGNRVFSGTMAVSELSSFSHCPASVKGPVSERLASVKGPVSKRLASVLFSETGTIHTGLLVLKERLLHRRLFHLSAAHLCRSQIFTI